MKDSGCAYVRAMESNPPPAPASACATLSLCWAAVLWGSGAVDSASFSCAFSCVEDMALMLILVLVLTAWSDVRAGRISQTGGRGALGAKYAGTAVATKMWSGWVKDLKRRQKECWTGDAAQMRRHVENCGSVAGS
jgi:hypothetical protein